MFRISTRPDQSLGFTPSPKSSRPQGPRAAPRAPRPAQAAGGALIRARWVRKPLKLPKDPRL
jgi:hypothetical protein